MNSQVCCIARVACKHVPTQYLYGYTYFIRYTAHCLVEQLRSKDNNVIIVSRCFQKRKILFRSARRIFAFRRLRKLSTRPPRYCPLAESDLARSGQSRRAAVQSQWETTKGRTGMYGVRACAHFSISGFQYPRTGRFA